jgi:uncharacterized protein YndB with AHSA1/START domain
MAKTEFTVVPGRPEVVVSGVFNTRKANVYRACTDSSLIPQWWGPANLTTKVEKHELWQGGQWRFVQHDRQGKEFVFRGVYHTVIPAERLTYTFEFEGMPGHVMLVTDTYAEADGKTKWTEQSVYQSVEDRDAMIDTGMENGERESMDRLETLLEKMKK